MVDSTYELKVPAKTENLSLIGEFIELILRRLGADEEVFPVQLAVDEACTNVIVHSYQGECNKPVAVNCSIIGEQFIVRIEDWGQPFNPYAIPPPDLSAEPDDRRLGGLGIFIMQKMMDSVEYNFRANRHNQVIMTKKLQKRGPAKGISVYDWPAKHEYQEAMDAWHWE